MKPRLDPRFDQPAMTKCHTMEDIGRVLRTRRKELGYTQEWVALRCGFSRQLIGAIVGGRATVDIGKVMEYASGLGVDFVMSVRGKSDGSTR